MTESVEPKRKGTMRERLGPPGYALHRIGIKLGLLFGGSFFYPSDDREILQNVILPFYQLSTAHNDILMAGTDWYTHGYVRMFSHKRLATIDHDGRKAQYGAVRHIFGSVADLDRHFAPASLDLVTLNGLIGWGLDTAAEADRTIEACHACLREGGHLLIGWNDLPERRPFALGQIASLGRFRPLTFPPLGKAEPLSTTSGGTPSASSSSRAVTEACSMLQNENGSSRGDEPHTSARPDAAAYSTLAPEILTACL